MTKRNPTDLADELTALLTSSKEAATWLRNMKQTTSRARLLAKLDADISAAEAAVRNARSCSGPDSDCG